VRQREHSAGIDAVTLREFEDDWAQQMATLADELRSGLYRPLPPRHVAIPKKSGSERVIAILTVRDRVAQRAVKQVLEPLFDPLFLDCSFGCRPRVGVPDALTQVSRYAERGLVWVVDADIARYFDTIDHKLLMGMVRQRIDEMPVLQVINRWLEVGTLTDEDAQAYIQEHKVPQARVSREDDEEESWGNGKNRWAPTGGSTLYDPYGLAPWQRGVTAGSGNGLLDERVWSALALAKPVVNGVRRALPYAKRASQQIGGKRLAVAGGVVSVVAASVAAHEAWRRQREKRRGAMQGGALSPLLANIYLHPFDLAVTSQGLRMVRFLDDFVILCATEEDAQQALELARRQLTTLRLAVNEEKTGIVAYEDGLEFLGQALVPRQSGTRLTEGLKSFQDAAEMLKQQAKKRKKRSKE
jgi:RNA-directed DNA polymerase